MGQFSFLTSDTNESIPNCFSKRSPFTVYMLDDKGNVWTETAYEGYGVFGLKDYYQLFAEMNCINKNKNNNQTDETNETNQEDERDGNAPDRDAGIDLWFHNEQHYDPNVLYPYLTRNPEAVWKNVRTKGCPHQGYFYCEEDEEEE